MLSLLLRCICPTLHLASCIPSSLCIIDNQLWPLGSQHWVVACLELIEERKNLGPHIPRFMSNPKVVVIKSDTNLDTRQKISGKLNKVTLLSRRTTNTELLKLYKAEIEKHDTRLAAWRAAVDKAGLDALFRSKYRSGMKPKKGKAPDDDAVVCPQPLYLSA